MDNFKKMLDFLGDLKQQNIHFTLEHNCPESVMVMIAVPGERWEVEFFADEPVRVEIFRSSDVEHNPEKELERLFRDFSDQLKAFILARCLPLWAKTGCRIA